MRGFRKPITDNAILVTRASDLMSAHDPRLWETIRGRVALKGSYSQKLGI